FDTLQHRVRTGMPGRGHRKRDRRNHKNHRRRRSYLRKRARSTAWPEGGLAAHAAKRGRDIARAAALQQHHNDDKEANNDVDESDKCDHASDLCAAARLATTPSILVFQCTKKILVRKGGFEPPRLAAPPPQDGVSASSTTSAGRSTTLNSC